MASISKKVVGLKREARRPAALMKEGRDLECRELDQVVGGLGVGLMTVGPLAPFLSTVVTTRSLSARSVIRPLGGLLSRVAPAAGVAGGGTLSGGLSTITEAGSDRGEA